MAPVIQFKLSSSIVARLLLASVLVVLAAVLLAPQFCVLLNEAFDRLAGEFHFRRRVRSAARLSCLEHTGREVRHRDTWLSSTNPLELSLSLRKTVLAYELTVICASPVNRSPLARTCDVWPPGIVRDIGTNSYRGGLTSAAAHTKQPPSTAAETTKPIERIICSFIGAPKEVCDVDCNACRTDGRGR